MARHAHEFHCTNCSWYNRPMLSDKMFGNYTIKCGHCGHEHYRVIKNGVVTEDRHDKTYGTSDVIHVMPSACSKTKQPEGKKGVVTRIRELAIAGLAK